uniref:Aldose 1-epimerase n=1 Tax=Kalanchoe fedtschenkoi TaxID=63787 RepID=A0A7N0RE68_KALFE
MERKLKFQVCIFLCVISFGLKCAATVSAQSAGIYELKKGNFSAKFTNWGASLVSLILPDKTGKLADIVLGFQAVDEYKNNTPNFGAIVGRVANRIKGAQFSLNGIVYKIIANDGNNTLHGGEFGFAHVLWKVTNYQKCCDNPSITFSYLSPDGDQGFPGDLLAKVTYKIVGGTELRVIMSAKALKTETPVNLAQHTYWNLGGHDSGTILLNKVKILATHYTPVDSELIPTGKLKLVAGTPYDFLKSQTVGSRIKKLPTGYDINYALEAANELKIVAVVHDEKSGRVMQLRTNAVGMQFYTANSLKDVKGKGGFVYQPHSALCLETQGFPNAVNQPNFPSQIVVPAKPYKHVMVYKFSTVK